MVSRTSSPFPIIFITLLILAAGELSCLAMDLLAAESGRSRMKGTLSGLPPAGNPRDEVAAVDSLAGLPATSLELVLTGIVGGGNRDDSRAVILNKNEKKQQMYQVGDMVAGARIKSIQWGKVVLSAHGRDEVLGMSATAEYRGGAVAVPANDGADPATGQGSPGNKTIASFAEGAPPTGRLVPGRIRLVLPPQATESSPPGE